MIGMAIFKFKLDSDDRKCLAVIVAPDEVTARSMLDDRCRENGVPSWSAAAQVETFPANANAPMVIGYAEFIG